MAALQNLFDDADRNDKLHVYAALFELEDKEIIQRFCELGKRTHIVLANGSSKASEPDENAYARSQLRAAGCDVIDRMTAAVGHPGNLAHNKFIVVAEDDKPVAVWTGSTNPTPTGLFTQINNAVLIHHPDLAGQYLTQWHRLAGAQSDAPSSLKQTNAAPAAGINAPVRIQPWFTPTVGHIDLDRLRQLVNGAKSGILFLSFMPGPSGPVMDLLEQRSAGLYVRGVINQFVGGAKGKLVGELVGGSKLDPLDLDVVAPSGIHEQFAFWADEFMKGGKISVLVHSKVMCIDPFGPDPVVVTGSHNFSSMASESNDENFLVIEGNKAIAAAYSAHIMSVYGHYRWRKYVALVQAAEKQPWQKLDADPAWQASRIHSAKQAAEWAFWLPA